MYPVLAHLYPDEVRRWTMMGNPRARATARVRVLLVANDGSLRLLLRDIERSGGRRREILDRLGNERQRNCALTVADVNITAAGGMQEGFIDEHRLFQTAHLLKVRIETCDSVCFECVFANEFILVLTKYPGSYSECHSC